MDKEKQIEEIAKIIDEVTGCYYKEADICAKLLYDAGYCKRNTGHWEEIRTTYGEFKGGEFEGWLHIECGQETNYRYNYCPKCGAKMD